MSIEIKLPDLGDNIESGTVVSVYVSEGDQIQEEQALLELETDKAVVEVPASNSGKVTKILVKNGDEIKEGQVILELESSDNGSDKPGAEETKEAVQKETEKQPAAKPAEEKPAAKSTPAVAKKPESGLQSSEIVNFKIPNMGDNVDSGTVSSVLVKVGEEVDVDQGLVELETDKAVV